MRPKIICSALIAILSLPAFSQTVVTLDQQIDSAESCSEMLAEFNWICKEFETPGWERIYDYPFWRGGVLEIARHDLDADGLMDVVVRIRHIAYCGTSGCSNLFLFGGDPVPEYSHAYSINADSNINLVERDGQQGIVFEGGTAFFPIQKIKTEARNAPEMGMMR